MLEATSMVIRIVTNYRTQEVLLEMYYAKPRAFGAGFCVSIQILLLAPIPVRFVIIPREDDAINISYPPSVFACLPCMRRHGRQANGVKQSTFSSTYVGELVKSIVQICGLVVN